MQIMGQNSYSLQQELAQQSDDDERDSPTVLTPPDSPSPQPLPPPQIAVPQKTTRIIQNCLVTPPTASAGCPSSKKEVEEGELPEEDYEEEEGGETAAAAAAEQEEEEESQEASMETTSKSIVPTKERKKRSPPAPKKPKNDKVAARRQIKAINNQESAFQNALKEMPKDYFDNKLDTVMLKWVHGQFQESYTRKFLEEQESQQQQQQRHVALKKPTFKLLSARETAPMRKRTAKDDLPKPRGRPKKFKIEDFELNENEPTDHEDEEEKAELEKPESVVEAKPESDNN